MNKTRSHCFCLLLLATPYHPVFSAEVGVGPGGAGPVAAVAKSNASGKIFFVRGSTTRGSTGAGAVINPFPTIKAALTRAKSGDTIRIASGFYDGESRRLKFPEGILVQTGWIADFTARTTNANVKLEKRADGLHYRSGDAKPFSGVNAELEMLPGRANQDIGFSTLTPYRQGRIDGTKRFFYPKGALEQERIYKKGKARRMTAYFGSGMKKFEAELNADELMQGAHTRWYPDGTIHARTLHDRKGEFHGEAFEYSEDGKLKAHYLWEHGTIVKIFFETPAQIKHRHEKYGRVPWE